MPAVKQRWQCDIGLLSAKGVGTMTFIDCTMNETLNCRLNEHMTPSLKSGKRGQSGNKK